MDQRVIQLLIDSFGQILLPGLTMTIPLTVISFSLAMVIAIITALVQFANIRVLKQIARFYIWVVRGTPLLVQLFVVFYGLPDIGIVLDPSRRRSSFSPSMRALTALRPCGRRWKLSLPVRWRRAIVWA